MATFIGFRHTTDSIAILLIVYSVIYFLAVKYLNINKEKKNCTDQANIEANQ